MTSMVHLRTYITFLAFACVTNGTFSQPLDLSTDRMRKAKSAFLDGTTLQMQGGKHAEAILEFQEALRYDTSAVILTAMARSYLELGKLERAEECVQAALRIDTTFRDGWEMLSEIQIATGRYDDGLASYENIMRFSPTRRQIYTLARLYEPRNAKRSAELYERCVLESPDIGIYQRLASLYQRMGNNVKRIEALEGAFQLDRNNRMITADLIEAYVAVGRISDATTIAGEGSRKRNPSIEPVELWTFLINTIAADSAIIETYPNDCRDVLDKTLTFYHNEYGPLLSAGDLALRMSDTDRAQQLYDAGVLLLPRQCPPEPFLHICTSYLFSDHPGQALSLALEYKNRFPTDARFYQIMGDASIALGDQVKGMQFFETALQLEPQLTDVWIQLGILADNNGKKAESDHAYRRALALDPGNPVALNNLAYLMSARNASLDTARALAVQAVNQQPTNPAYLDTYAWILFRLGDLDRARVIIDQAIAYGGNATHYEHLGDILERQGETEKAVTAWQQALLLEPDRLYLNERIARYR